jgi:hypothetical protein
MATAPVRVMSIPATPSPFTSACAWSPARPALVSVADRSIRSPASKSMIVSPAGASLVAR